MLTPKKPRIPQGNPRGKSNNKPLPPTKEQPKMGQQAEIKRTPAGKTKVVTHVQQAPLNPLAVRREYNSIQPRDLQIPATKPQPEWGFQDYQAWEKSMEGRRNLMPFIRGGKQYWDANKPSATALRDLGYVPTAWEDPRTVVRYYNFLQTAPKDWTPPTWLNPEEVKTAYELFKTKNENKPPEQWKFLNAQDEEARTWLQGILPPPEHMRLPTDRWFQGMPEIEERPAPTYQPGKLNPTIDWTKLPAWQKPMFYALSNPLTAPLAQLGIITLMSRGNPISIATGAAMVVPAYMMQAKNPTIRAIGEWATRGLMWPQQQVERLQGLQHQLGYEPLNSDLDAKWYDWIPIYGKLAQLARDTDPEKWREIFSDPETLKAAWQAGDVYYETQSPSLRGLDLSSGDFAAAIGNILTGFKGREKLEAGQVWRFPEPVYDGAGNIIDWKYYPEPAEVEPGYTLADARQRVLKGEDPTVVLADYQRVYGVSGVMNDLAMSSIADPLNAVPVVESKAGSLIAGKIAKTAAAAGDTPKAAKWTTIDMAFRASMGQGVFERGGFWDTYKQLIRTSRFVDELSGFDKSLAGLTETGAIKSFEKNTSTGVKGFIKYLTSLTPEAKARIWHQHSLETFVSTALTGELDIDVVEKLWMDYTNQDMAGLRDAGATFLGSPEAYTVLPSVAAFKSDAVELFANYHTADRPRQLVVQLADILDITPDDVVKQLLDKDPAVEFQRLVDLAQRSQSNEASLFLADVRDGRVTADVMADSIKVFKDHAVPLTPQEFAATFLNQLSEHTGKWLKDFYGLSEDSNFFKMAGILKSAQSLMLLSLSPTYPINNLINGEITMLATGTWGFMPNWRIDETMKRFGWTGDLEPRRFRAGLGAAAEGAETGLRSPGEQIIERTVEGEKGFMNTAKRAVSSVNNKVGIFSTLAKKMERWQSRRTFAMAARRFYGRYWHAGEGFERMPAALEYSLDRIDPNYKKAVYAAIENGMNWNEIRDALTGGVHTRNVQLYVQDAAARLGKTPSDIADALTTTGVMDYLQSSLPNAKTPDQVKRIFAGVEQRYNDHADRIHGDALRNMADMIQERVRAEGFAAVADVWTEMLMHQMDQKIYADSVWDNCWNQARADPDNLALRRALAGQAAADVHSMYRRANERQLAHMKGIIEAIGMDETSRREYLGTQAKIHEKTTEFFRVKSEEIRRFFATEFENFEQRSAAWYTLVSEQNARYLELVGQVSRLTRRMDTFLAEWFEGNIGQGKGADVMTWREQVRFAFERRGQIVFAFRDAIKDLPMNERDRLWQSFKRQYLAMFRDEKMAEIEGLRRIWSESLGEELPAAIERQILGDTGEPRQPGETPEPPPAQPTQPPASPTTMADLRQTEMDELIALLNEYGFQLKNGINLFEEEMRILKIVRTFDKNGWSVGSLEGMSRDIDMVRRAMTRWNELEKQRTALLNGRPQESESLGAVTKSMERYLIDLGYTQGEVDGMTPTTAWEIIGKGDPPSYSRAEAQPKPEPVTEPAPVFTPPATEGPKPTYVKYYNLPIADYPDEIKAKFKQQAQVMSGQISITPRESLLRAIVRKGGLMLKDMGDVVGEKKLSRYNRQGIPIGLFNKKGMGLDNMAIELHGEEGFTGIKLDEKTGLPETNSLIDLIRQEVSGKKVYSAWTEGQPEALPDWYTNLRRPRNEIQNALVLVQNEREGRGKLFDDLKRTVFEELENTEKGLHPEQLDEAEAYQRIEEANLMEAERAAQEAAQVFNEAEWIRTADDFMRKGEIDGLLEHINKLPENSDLLEYGATLLDMAATVMEQKLEHESIAKIHNDAQTAIKAAEERAKIVWTRDSVNEYLREEMGLGEVEADAFTSVVNGTAKWFARVTNDSQSNFWELAFNAIRKGTDEERQAAILRILEGNKDAQYDGVLRGMIEFEGELKATYTLFSDRNVSTMPHEYGHHLLRMMYAVNEMTGGNIEIARDIRIMEDWAGVKNGDWSTKQEERFARAFEAYLSEGKAPTPTLRFAFEAFKVWLLDIYKGIKAALLDVGMSANVRDVFDRLLGKEPTAWEETPQAALVKRIEARADEIGGPGRPREEIERAESMRRLADMVTQEWERGGQENYVKIEKMFDEVEEASNSPLPPEGQTVLVPATPSETAITQDVMLERWKAEPSSQWWEGGSTDDISAVTAKIESLQSQPQIIPEPAQPEIQWKKARIIYDRGPNGETIISTMPIDETPTPLAEEQAVTGKLFTMPGEQLGMAFLDNAQGHIDRMIAPLAHDTMTIDPGRTSIDSNGAVISEGDIVVLDNGERYRVDGVTIEGKIKVTPDELLNPADVMRIAKQGEMFSDEYRTPTVGDIVEYQGEQFDVNYVSSGKLISLDKNGQRVHNRLHPSQVKLVTKAGSEPTDITPAVEPTVEPPAILDGIVPPASTRDNILFNDLLHRIRNNKLFEKSRDFETFLKSAGYDLDSEADLNMAYDVMEGAYNMRAREIRADLDARNAPIAERLKVLDELENSLTEARRTISKSKLQQFSTPITISEAAGYVADVQPGDVVGEPTAGTGNLVDRFADNADVTVKVNEIDPGRRKVLEMLGYKPTGLDLMKAEWVLSKDGVKLDPWANVVISNPPWGSYSTGKYGRPVNVPVILNDWSQRFTFLTLQRMPDDARFVGVMPANWLYTIDRVTRKITDKPSPFYRWLKDNYTVHAIIESPPGAYKNRATDISSLLVVLDKRTHIFEVPTLEKWGANAPEDWNEYATYLTQVPKRTQEAISNGQSRLRPVIAGPDAAGIADPNARAGIHKPAPDRIGQPPIVDGGRTAEPGRTSPGGQGIVAGRDVQPDLPNAERNLGEQPGDTVPQVVEEKPGGVSQDVPKLIYSERYRRKQDEGRAAVRTSASFTEYVARSPLTESDVSHSHPAIVVETKGLAGVPAPKLEEQYRPSPGVMRAMRNRSISMDGNVDPIWAAIQQNDKHHMGILIADDVGMGKSRTAAGFVIDRIEKGRKRILVITKDEQNVLNLMNTEFPQVWAGVADENGAFLGTPPKDFPAKRIFLRGEYMPKVKKGAELPPTFNEPTVYFVTSSEFAEFYSAINHLKMDAVVVDEVHAFKGLETVRAKPWIDLHKDWISRNTDIMYMSATPGTDIADLQYLYGLRIWSMDGFSDWVKVITGEISEAKAKDIGKAKITVETWLDNIGNRRSTIKTTPIEVQYNKGVQVGNVQVIGQSNYYGRTTNYWFRYGDTGNFDRVYPFIENETKAVIVADILNQQIDPTKPVDNFEAMLENATRQFDEQYPEPTRQEIQDVGMKDATDILGKQEKKGWGKKGNKLGAFKFTLSPAHTEQIMRELKVAGSYVSRDISRAGVDFNVQEYKPTATQISAMNDRIRLYRRIFEAWRKYGRMNKGPKKHAALYGVNGDIQADAKRALFNMRIPGILEEARKAMEAGQKVVISIVSVGEVDDKAGNLVSGISKINTQKVDKLGDGVFSDPADIPEAMLEIAEIREALANLPPMPSPVDIFKDAFGDKVEFVVGDTTTTNRIKTQKRFQADQLPVIVISKAGKTGINLHDLTGKRVHLIVGDYEWSATDFKQELGRVDRTGQLTSPIVTVMHTGSAGERKFIATISNRMKGLGATSKGGSESTGTGVLTDAFELGSTIDKLALAETWQELTISEKKMFLDHYFSDPTTPDVPRPYLEPDVHTIEKFTLALQSMEIDEANRIFDKFLAKRDEMIAASTDNEAMLDLGAKTASNTGDIIRRIDLDDNLRMSEVQNTDGNKFAIVDGVLTPHMNEIRGIVTAGGDYADRIMEGGRAWMQWVEFYDPTKNERVAGLRIKPSRIKDLAAFFNQALGTSHTPETAIVDLRAGDHIKIVGENGNVWELYLGRGGSREDKIVVDGAKMSNREAVMRNGAQYNSIGNFFYVEQEKLQDFLKRFPIHNDAPGPQANTDPRYQFEWENRTTSTPEFIDWFGRSKITDGQGEPMIVYHGTDADFTVFQRSPWDMGYHFGTPDQANIRAKLKSDVYENVQLNRVHYGREQSNEPTHFNVMPVYLRIENPLRLPDLGGWSHDTMFRELIELFPEDDVKLRTRITTNEEMVAYIKSKGYDGIVYRNTAEVEGASALHQAWVEAHKRYKATDPLDELALEKAYQETDRAFAAMRTYMDKNSRDSYMIFDNDQVKSAFNKGTFDRQNPDILYQIDEPPADSTLFQDGGNIPLLPPNAYDQLSGVFDQARAMDEYWMSDMQPILSAMQDSALQTDRTFFTDQLPDQTRMEMDRYLAKVRGQQGTARHMTMRMAESMRDNALLPYHRQYGADKVLQLGVPYEFFTTRTAANWLMRVLDRPAWFANYARLMKAHNTYKNDLPERMRNKMYIPLPFLPAWAGDGIYIDPMPGLFPPSMFLQPLKMMQRDQDTEARNVERLIDEWYRNGTITQPEAAAALSAKNGPVWERALSQVQVEAGGEKTPYDYITTLLSPALYLTIPYYLATGKKLGSAGWPAGQLPITRTGQALETAFKGTSLEPLGNMAGLMALPEKKARQALGVSEFGEWGDYYVDRQIANLVADGSYTPAEGRKAMIERKGAAFDEAMERVKLELMARVPGMLPMYGVTHGAQWNALIGSVIPSLFPAGILPEGEVEFRGQKAEYNKAWSAYKAGDKKALSTFFDTYPEYQARLALSTDPDDRLYQFLKSEIWDKYNALGDTHKRQARSVLGKDFETFVFSDDQPEFSVDTLAKWAQQLGAEVPSEAPQVLTEEGKPKTFEPAEQVNWYSPEIASVMDGFYAERTEKFPNWYHQQQGYYMQPKSSRAAYLMRYPELSRYFDWKDAFKQANPGLESWINSDAYQNIDTTAWPDLLLSMLTAYALTGEKLDRGTMALLTQVWMSNGQPLGDVQSWLDSQVVPTLINQMVANMVQQ